MSLECRNTIAAKVAGKIVLLYFFMAAAGLSLLYLFNSNRYIAAIEPLHYIQDTIFLLLSCCLLFILIHHFICRQQFHKTLADQSEIQYRSLFDNMSEGSMVYKPVNNGEDFVVLDINTRGLEIHKSSIHDYGGKKLSCLLSSNDIDPELSNSIHRVFRTGVPEQCPVVKYRDGELELYRTNYIFRLDSLNVVTIYDDITEKKRLEEDLKQSQYELTLQNKIITLFLMTEDDSVYQDVLTLITRNLQSSFGLMGYVDHTRQFVATRLNDSQPSCNRYTLQEFTASTDAVDTILGSVLRSGNSRVQNSAIRSPVEQSELRNSLAVPIKCQDSIIGVILLGNRENAYTRSDRQLLENICAYIAPVLKARIQVQHNKRLHTRAITELKKSEATLKEAEKLAKIGHFEHDFTQNSISWSDEVYRIFGLNRNEFIPDTKNSISHIHPDDRELVKRSYREAVAAQKRFSLVHRIITKDGTVKYIHSHSITTYDTDSGPIYSLGTIQDITAKVQAEKANKRLATAIDQSVDVVVITDKDGIIQYVNPAFAKLTGYSREEVIGHSPAILQSGTHPKSFYKGLWDIINSGNVWRGRFVNKNKNGKIFTEEASITPVKDDNGKIVNFVAVKHDISRELELEQQLRQAVKMEAMGTLAGGIAHDFNNILGAILGYTRMAMDELPPDSQPHQDLSKVIQSGDRAADLIKQILLFSRHQQQGLVPIQIQHLVKEAVKMIRVSLPPGVTLHKTMEDNTPPIMANPTQIHQVIMNLCTNARQSMIPDGGILSIDLSAIELKKDQQRRAADMAPGKYIRLTISDTGSGISKKDLPRIFDPFFTTKGVSEGTGLGLAVVHGIVSSHGGTIHVASELEKGTTFTLFFPVVDADIQNLSTKEQKIHGGTEHIMVVDDDPNILTLRQRLLSKMGYQVTGFFSSPKALAAFQENPQEYDLLLTDMNMPEMDGRKLAASFLHIRPDIPAILCTGHSELVNQQNAEKYGFQALLEKPIKPETLAETLRRLLDRRQTTP